MPTINDDIIAIENHINNVVMTGKSTYEKNRAIIEALESYRDVDLVSGKTTEITAFSEGARFVPGGDGDTGVLNAKIATYKAAQRSILKPPAGTKY